MVVAAAVQVFCGVSDVEHFVKDDVFDHIMRNLGRIEGSTDGDVAVSRIVMAQYAVCFAGRPRQSRLWDKVAEIPAIQVLKNLVEIIDQAF